MSASKKSTKPAVKVADLKPTKSAKGGIKLSTHSTSGLKTHGTK